MSAAETILLGSPLLTPVILRFSENEPVLLVMSRQPTAPNFTLQVWLLKS